jgi:vacuolar iron transporter family protein
MRDSYKIGLGFGLTSGTITTLGLMIGLYATTGSKLVLIGGILSIAIADALSDALGIHVSQETKKKSKKKDVWEATIATFASKFLFALTFLIPILLFELQTAIIISICWGIALIIASTIYLNKKKDWKKQIIEHLGLAIAVILITFYVGQWIATTFM